MLSLVGRLGLWTGITATVWAVAVCATGGFAVVLHGVTLRSHDPLRPLIVAALGWVAYFGTGHGLRRSEPWDATRTRVLCLWAAAYLALATFGIGVAFATTAVGGSDSYGYASQADLWIAGKVTLEQQWITAVPWPNAAATFSPLGYSPSPKPNEPWTLVPTYPPGLPWLMAAAKLAGGQETMFWVSPVFGALLVFATYGIGCQFASPLAGLLAAWFVATSPTMLFMLVAPMSDVPAAGAWAVAWCLMRRPTLAHTAAAGLASALAITIRPNLVLGSIIIGCWCITRALAAGRRDRVVAIRQASAFTATVLPGIGAIAFVNYVLNGSPLGFGYGGMEGWFSARNLWPNVRLYVGWLVESQTPIALAGLVALVIPARWLWPALADRTSLFAAAAFVLTLWIFYGLYWQFDAWWTLRFLLPTWPFMMTGVGALFAACMRAATVPLRVALSVAALAYGGWTIYQADARLAFDMWKNDRQYPAVARVVGSLTDAQTVILSRQHSGSLRYYAGRVTLRYDSVDPAWLDLAVDWLRSRGVRVYLLAHTWELEAIKKRFAGQRVLEVLDRSPTVDYRGPTTVLLFNLSELSDTPPIVVRERYANLRSVPSVPLVIPAFSE